MCGNFMDAFFTDFRFPGIKLADRSARRFGIEVAPRGRTPGTRRDVCHGSFLGRATVVGGVLPVGGFDGSAVSHAPLDTHG
jgi:hypothetical protein